MAGFLDGLAGAIGLGGLIGQNQANETNKSMSNTQMKWQKQMSDSAHQREVRDLKLAGLNPILSANSGASTPSGAQAVMQNSAAAGIESALAAKQMFQQMEKQKHEISLLDAQTAKTVVDAKVATKGLPEADIKNRFYNMVTPLLDRLQNGAKDVKEGMEKTPEQRKQKWNENSQEHKSKGTWIERIGMP